MLPIVKNKKNVEYKFNIFKIVYLNHKRIIFFYKYMHTLEIETKAYEF